MVDLVNFYTDSRDRCSQVIEDIQGRYGVVITIHDDLGILRLPDGQCLLKQRFYHMHPYCLLEREKRPGFNQYCNDHCSTGVAKRCHVDQRPYLSCCWKGMREIIVPIWRNGIHHITLYAAGYRDKKNNNAPDDSFSKTIRDAYQELPFPDEDTINEITRVLHTLGLGMLQEIDNARQIESSDNARKNQIERFIYNNAHQQCSLKDLAEYLFLSPSRCGQVVRDLFNTSFQDLVINERISRAKHLLLYSDLNQEAIAAQCGFNNHFYFNRLFKKVEGISPGRYRQQQMD